jgi:FMN-dependent NADH-azoreductase
MATLLYITAHPHDESVSFSMATGEAFRKAYKEAHPNDEVIHLDLYRAAIPHIDNDVFSGWGKLAQGTGFAELSAEEQRKIGRLTELVDQFVKADKYVFVSPMWNFSFPPVLKAYIDSISVAGKTFKYTEQGPVGLLNGKKALHIQASGGIYSEGPGAGMEMGFRYLKTVMGFLGVQDINSLFVEGMGAMPDKAQEIKAQAILRAQELAKSF